MSNSLSAKLNQWRDEPVAPLQSIRDMLRKLIFLLCFTSTIVSFFNIRFTAKPVCRAPASIEEAPVCNDYRIRVLVDLEHLRSVRKTVGDARRIAHLASHDDRAEQVAKEIENF